jgi:methionine biosynthesis protein MetW
VNAEPPIQLPPRDVRADLALISTLVADNARVLEVGCEDGALLELLSRERGVDGRGIEISQAGVNRCVARGLSVIQGDADTDLAGYPDGAFDYVILSQTIQQVRRPATVLKEMLRIGKHAIVSFPNFAHWRMRLNLLFLGRMPRTKTLPYSWHETPNIHQCTLADFEALCREMNVRIERCFSVWHGAHAGTREVMPQSAWSNLMAQEVLFLLSVG